MLHEDNIDINNGTPIGKGRILLKDNTLIRMYQTSKDPFVSNKVEQKNIYATRNLSYVEKVYSYDVKSGRKESLLLKNAIKIECNNMNHIRLAAELLKKFHSSRVKLPNKVKLIKRLKFYKRYSESITYTKEEKEIINETKKLIKAYPFVNCHNNLNQSAILVKGDEAFLYSLEYAGKNICLFDLATIIYYFELKDEEIDLFLKHYGEVNKKDVETMLAFVRIYFKYRDDFIAMMNDN